MTGENVKYNPDTREFDFTFSEDAGTDPYILKFTTDVVQPGNYSNTVEFKGVSTDQTASVPRVESGLQAEVHGEQE